MGDRIKKDLFVVKINFRGLSRVVIMESSSPMKAPILQEMGVDLEELDGLIVRQVTQFTDVASQTFGIPFEAKNKYQVFALPHGKIPPAKNKDTEAWYPSAQELKDLNEVLFIQEESGFWNRFCMACIGCLNLRPLRLHFMSRGADQFLGIRPYRIGGVCCRPLEMTIVDSRKNDTVIGKVIENFTPYGSKCCEACCMCTSYTSVLPEGAKTFKYTLRRSECCCGRVNNCCGATCCNETLIVDVLDENDNLVGTITKFYAPGKGGQACCRACYGFVNFALKFPEGTNEQDRILLLSAMMAQDYQFSRTGGDDN
jgi:hypothetical protein